MKKKLSRWLLWLAVKLDHSALLKETPTAKPMGLCLHIRKKDVRDYRKKHPEFKSHRDGMAALIEEAKWRIAGSIGRGMMEKGVIDFSVKKALYVADVSGIAFVYAKDEEKSDEQA